MLIFFYILFPLALNILVLRYLPAFLGAKRSGWGRAGVMTLSVSGVLMLLEYAYFVSDINLDTAFSIRPILIFVLLTIFVILFSRLYRLGPLQALYVAAAQFIISFLFLTGVVLSYVIFVS
jgi:hypothetical protein